MPNASIGGLVSGLDTATIIRQLIQLEARPQTMLKSRVSTAERQVTALQSVNVKLAGIETKAAALAKNDAWSPMRATSDNEKVTVTAGSGALPTNLELSVVQRAISHKIDFGLHALSDPITTDGSTTVKLSKADGTSVDLDTGDGTVQGLVKAVNASSAGVTASLVKVDDTSYRLVLAATETGPSSSFDLQDDTGVSYGAPDSKLTLTGSATAGTVARITVGADTIESESNTFKDLTPGVNVTLNAGATGSATITVARDREAVTASVKALVDAVNEALSEVTTLTTHGVDGKGGGLLSGDSTLRSVRSQILSLVTGGVSGESLASYGVQTDRYGKVVFDEAKFDDAFAADPTQTSSMFVAAGAEGGTDGFAGKLQKLVDGFSDSVDGTVTQSIKSRQGQVSGWKDDIADWDVRLSAREATLQRQYAALEVALGQLQSQSSWLAGQLASLPRMSSGSGD